MGQAQAWYEERSLLAAAGFLDDLSKSVRAIAEAPARYPHGPHGTRRKMLVRFPFTVYYRTTEDAITVVAVAHQKRRPYYWAGR